MKVDQEKECASVEAEIRSWLETVVIGLNLCPFASKPYGEKKVRIAVEESTAEEDILACIVKELSLLDQLEASELETTVLALPNIFPDFYEYNDFLYTLNEFIKIRGWDGVYQVASFHPKYQFSGTEEADVENYTNRAPYPVFHLIREDSLEKAIQYHPDPDSIPETNIKLMQAMSEDDVKRYFFWCFS